MSDPNPLSWGELSEASLAARAQASKQTTQEVTQQALSTSPSALSARSEERPFKEFPLSSEALAKLAREEVAREGSASKRSQSKEVTKEASKKPQKPQEAPLTLKEPYSFKLNLGEDSELIFHGVLLAFVLFLVIRGLRAPKQAPQALSGGGEAPRTAREAELAEREAAREAREVVRKPQLVYTSPAMRREAEQLLRQQHAEREAKAQAEREAQEAKSKAEREAKETKAQAEREANAQAKAQAEREAKAQAEREAQEAKAQAEGEAKAQAEGEAKAQAEREAQEAKAQAEREAKAQAEREAQEAKDLAEREAKKQAEREAKEAKARAEREAERAADDERGRVLRAGLAKTKQGFLGRLKGLFTRAKTIDDDLIADLEEALFTADIGVKTSQRLLDSIQEQLDRDSLKDGSQVWRELKRQISEMLLQDTPPINENPHGPTVIMVVGVNGAGKTTSIGKLAHHYVSEGKKVVLAAGDTFRAAAVDQLERWAERAGVEVVRGRDGQDPSSVIFDACKRAADSGADVILADTAGRLQARTELMDELAKVHRVIGKAIPDAPHEVWLVLDATNGQNAISQAKIFTERVAVTGVVLTKLDGTAKGGVIIGIKDEMKLPVRYIGVGERTEDLQVFDPQVFSEALFEGLEQEG